VAEKIFSERKISTKMSSTILENKAFFIRSPIEP
jgi:hypothetical protein